MANAEQYPSVAFQGTHYAFSEIAARTFFHGKIRTLPCRSFEDVFQAVDSGRARTGIVPIENSLTGSIHRNFDLLLEYDVQITGETALRIVQNLIALPGAKLADIRTIYSHPQALEQCRRFLSGLKNVDAIAKYDTAGSVKEIREKMMSSAAAIASQQAARDYDMQILQADIEDFPENFTRFHIISKEAGEIPQADKTSIAFAMKNIPGALFKSLSVFALRDIDLLKIESRPLRGKPWAYLFYLDFAGNMAEERCQNAIRHLEEITSFLKVLGSYPSHQNHS